MINKQMKKITVLLLPLLLAVVACRHERVPEGVLDQAAMTEFLADAYLLEGYYAISSEYRYDGFTDEMTHSYDSILDLHGLTREQVERSLDYYTSHLDTYQSILDSVVVRLEARRDSL